MSEFEDTSRKAPAARAGMASGGTCSISGSPFTAEELALLDRFRALKEERRRLAARLRAIGAPPWADSTATDGETRAASGGTPGPAAGNDGHACQTRMREIDAEAERLHQQAGDAWRRRMIALGYLDPDREPLVRLDELRRR